MNIFITGGTGLLGKNIIAQLLDMGHKVTALVRSPDQAKTLLDPANMKFVKGDMADISEFKNELAGHDVLIHSAAYYTEFINSGGKNDDLAQKINVEGSINLFQAAYDTGIKNIVYISSCGVLEEQKGLKSDENTAYAFNTFDGYFKSKIDAELKIKIFQEEHSSVRIVSILPSVMVGPMDTAPTPYGSFLIKLASARVPFVLPGRMSIVDVRDVAKAAIHAIEKGENGQRFVVGGTTHENQTIYNTVEKIIKRPVAQNKPPYALLYFFLTVMSFLSKFTKKQPPLSPSRLKRIKHHAGYNSQKATTELDFNFTPLDTTLTDTMTWFKENNMIE
ncbi:MAG: NAD-dependent epimerase/dehydratase family protein [Desulfobacteraceae bacterium]|nr:NAD-dependent epimerase/dehydratase family protein [Desulfobacteraceae bacterium]